MTRDGLEALVWRQAPALCGDHPEAAMAAILDAIDAYADARGEEVAILRTTRSLAACYAPDPAHVTARRRAELLEALREHEHDHPSVEIAELGSAA